MILNDNDQYGKVLKRLLLDYILVRRCNAGINKITICPDGTIYPCDSLVGNEQFVLGNMYQAGEFDKKFKQITVNTIERCATCNIKYLCGGDCYYNALSKCSEIYTPDPEFCELQECILNECIALRYKMQVADDTLYKKLVREIKRKDNYGKVFG